MNHPASVTLAAFSLFALAAAAAVGAPPPNDDFAAAIDLGTTTNTTTSGTNVESTEEFGEPNPTANPDIEPFATVWWQFAVPADGFVEISTEGSDFDTLLGVFTGPDLFSLNEVASDDNSGAGTTSELTFPAVSGLTYYIQVSGTSADEGAIALAIGPGSGPTPPVLNTITLTPSPIDVTSQSGVVTATLQIDSPDGFDYGEIGVFDPSSNDTGAGGRFDEVFRTSGDEFSGTYEIPLSISTFSPPGTHSVDLNLVETSGDTAFYGSGGQSWPGGASGTFEVINNGTVDAAPPSITSFSFTPNSVDVSTASQNLAVDVGASDDLGVQFVLVDVYDPDSFYLFTSVASLSSGNATSGTWSTTVPVARYSTAGIWRLDVRVIDLSGKTANYEPSGTEDEFTVVNNGVTDETTPSLVNLTFSPNPVVRGNQVTVSIEFADDLSGLATIPSNLFLDFYGPSAELQFKDPFSLADLVAGNAVAGTLQYPTTIQPTAPAGTWDTEIFLQDAAGNGSWHGNLNKSGGAFPYPAGVSGQLTVLETGGTAYEIWIARYPSLSGADADPLADPDADGWKNLLELIFDGDPTIPLSADLSAPNFPVALMTPSEFKLQFRLATGNLQGTTGSPIAVRGMKSVDLKSNVEVPIVDIGSGVSEIAISNSADPQAFLHIDVEDPN